MRAPKIPVVCEMCRLTGMTGTLAFTELIEKILDDFPDPKDLNYDDSKGDVWRLFKWSRNGPDCTGTMLRIRKSKKAFYAELEQDVVAELPLKEKQHIVDWFTFFYSHEFGTVVCNRNRDAGTYLRLAAYIRNFSDEYGLRIVCMPSKDAISRMNNLFSVKTLHLRYAVPDSESLLDLFSGDDLSRRDIEDISTVGRRYNGTEITIIISQGKSKRAIAAQRAKNLMLSTLSALGNDVKTARASGINSDDEIEPLIDLLEHRLVSHEEVTYTPGIQSIGTYYDALKRGYARRRPQIEAMFNRRS